MRFRYVAIDMDGTLLDDKKHIPQANVDEIKRLQEQGVEFIIVSGRHYHEITDVLAPYGITNVGYIIYRDGQYISKHGEVIHKGCMLTMSDIERLMKITEAREVFGSTIQQDYLFCRSIKTYIKKKMKAPKDGIKLESLHFAKLKRCKVGKVIFFNGELRDLTKLEKTRQFYTVHFVNGREYDVFPSDVNKYAALQWLSEHEGIDLNELVYLGDDYNDIECFENLPHCVVMGNGPKDLREYSIMQDVKTNNENGVADVLHRIFD